MTASGSLHFQRSARRWRPEKWVSCKTKLETAREPFRIQRIGAWPACSSPMRAASNLIRTCLTMPICWTSYREHARQTTTVVLNEWGRAEFDDENVKGRRHCQELHSMASAAIDELGCLSIVSKNAGAVGTSSLMRPLHKANAWLNVNRANDQNLMHVHNSCRWSGTYYVAAPPDSTEKLDGRLIFRAGSKRRADGQPSAASHSFMTVPPTPGSLWLFPGSIPHRVLGSTMVPGKYQKVEATERGMWAPRISVAINFLDALAGLSDNRVGAPPPSFPVGHG